jgi:hypothetical protein
VRGDAKHTLKAERKRVRVRVRVGCWKKGGEVVSGVCERFQQVDIGKNKNKTSFLKYAVVY